MQGNIEAFRAHLLHGVDANRSTLAHIRGSKLSVTLSRIRQMEEHVASVDNFVKPGSAGFGVIGEASFRAAHGGTFDYITALK